MNTISNPYGPRPERVAVIGAGRLGTYLAAFLPQAGNRYAFVGYFDDVVPRDFPQLLGAVSDIGKVYASGAFDSLLLGVGYNHLAARETLFNEISSTIPFCTYVHPTAWVDPSARLAPGCFVAPHCIVDQDVVMEANVMLNLDVMVAHNAYVGAHSFLAGNAMLAGYVVIGKRCFMGVRTTTIEKISLGDDVRSGAATTFTKDAPEPGLYVGTPARRIKD